MAFIPDEAVDRMTELSAGAWRLYCFLARCRNQKTGKCFPSVAIIMEFIGVNRGTVYALRKELQAKAWAEIDGDDVTNLFGFSLKNQTSGTANKEDTTYSDAESLKSQACQSELSENSDNDNSASLKNQTASLKNQTGESEFSDKKSEKSDSHIGRTSKRTSKLNQQTRTSKESGADAPGVSAEVLEVFSYWQNRLNHQQAKLTPERRRKVQARLKEKYTVEQIKSAIDGCASSEFHMGTSRDSNGTVYDDLELICRNGGKLEFFIAKGNSNNGKNDTTKTGSPKTTDDYGIRDARQI